MTNAPTPIYPRTNARQRWLSGRVQLAVGAALLLVLGAVGANFLASRATSPESAVSQYLGALEKGDADTAWKDSTIESSALGQTDGSLLSKEALQATLNNGRPSFANLQVASAHPTSEQESTVQVSYRRGGVEQHATYRLRQDDQSKHLGLYPLWRVVVTPAAFALRLPAGMGSASIDGQPIKLTADRSQRLAVFPGQHRLAIAATSLLQAQQVRFDATEALPKLTPVQLDLKVTPVGQSSAAASIKDALSRCAASGSLQPQGCPQRFSSVDTLRDPHWQVVGDPASDLAVALDPDNGLLAKGHFQMILAATEPVTGAVSHHAVGGAYQAVLAASADAVTVQSLEASSAVPPLSRPAAATDGAVRDAVRQALAACATSTSFFTPDCPQFHVLNDIQDPTKNVQWHLSGDPATAATISFDPTTGVIHAAGNFTMTLDYDQRLVGKDYPQHAEDSGGFKADLFWDGTKVVPVTISRPQ